MAIRNPIKTVRGWLLVVAMSGLLFAIAKSFLSYRSNTSVLTVVLSENTPDYVTRNIGGRKWLEFPDIERSVNIHRTFLEVDEVTEMLISSLKTNSPRTRRRVVFTLGYIVREFPFAQTQKIQDCLNRVVDTDTDADVADEAIGALRRIEGVGTQ